jgi:hypothetical protein
LIARLLVPSPNLDDLHAIVAVMSVRGLVHKLGRLDPFKTLDTLEAAALAIFLFDPPLLAGSSGFTLIGTEDLPACTATATTTAAAATSFSTTALMFAIVLHERR